MFKLKALNNYRAHNTYIFYQSPPFKPISLEVTEDFSVSSVVPCNPLLLCDALLLYAGCFCFGKNL
jgi:hypothetical protein